MSSSTLNANQIRSELIKCGKDPIYFITTYVKISNPTKGAMLFSLYDFQKDLINKFMSNRFNILLKARQLGASTAVAAYALWLLMFHRGKQIDVIATKVKTAAELVRKSRNMFKDLPDWMKEIFPIGGVDNRHEFEFENGSRMSSHASNSDIRSYASSLLIFDEAAHIENVDKVIEAAWPVLSTGGACIAISTPNGVGNWFEQTYTKSEKGIGSFLASKLDWRVHPDRDDEWHRINLENMGEDKFNQEFECSFLASGRTFLHATILKKIEDHQEKPMYCVGPDSNFWVWEQPEIGEEYLISVDTSRGDAEDFTAFHVFNVKMEQVAEYYGKLHIDLVAEFCASIGKEYNNAMIIAENNTFGYMFLTRIIEKEYPNVYFSEKSTHSYIPMHQAQWRVDVVAGVSNTPKTRDMMLAVLEEYIRKDQVKIRSSRLYSEFLVFGLKNNKAQALTSDGHDDLVMSLAILCWGHKEMFKGHERDIIFDRKLIEGIQVKRKQITKSEDVLGYDQSGNLLVRTGNPNLDRKKQNKRKWVVIT